MDRKLILFANWELGARTLSRLLDEGFCVCAVVTQYDEKMESEDKYFNIVHKAAISRGIKTFRDYNELLQSNIDVSTVLGISAAYNKIFRADILDKLQIVNFHPSRLPAYRGPSPIEWQIRDGLDAIGVTAHYIDSGIDTGSVIKQGKYPVDYSLSYVDLLDGLNGFLSELIVQTIGCLDNLNCDSTHTDNKGDYYQRLFVPENIKHSRLEHFRSVVNRPKIAFFTGNRAEFGILFPLILELSNDYFIDIFVSGAHLLEPWMSIEEIKIKIRQHNLPVNIIPVQMESTKDQYMYSLSGIYEYMHRFYKKYDGLLPYKYAIILGDRIETFGFAIASFYSRIPIIHICGGDVANVPYFDTNVRHSISKLAHIHFTTNEKSMEVLKQIGEEGWRITNIGNPVYDYDRMGLLLSPEDLEKELDIKRDDNIILCTHHPSHNKSSDENLSDFKNLIDALSEIEAKIIITSPNNDPGADGMLSFIDEISHGQSFLSDKCRFVNNLGTEKYLSLMKYFKTIVIGNSSSGLSETAMYCVPAINVGDRQTDRFRGDNVYDCSMDKSEIRNLAGQIINNYKSIKDTFKSNRFFFGDGRSALIVRSVIENLMFEHKEKLLSKRFVIGDYEQSYCHSATSR